MFDKKVEREIHRHYHKYYYEDPLSVSDYNPREDTLAVFVGSEDDIPPNDVFEKIAEQLEDLPKCKVMVFPGVFRIVVLKGDKK